MSCGKPTQPRCRPHVDDGPVTWDGIFRAYDRERRKGAKEELDKFAEEKSLDEVLSRAGLAEMRDGKRFDHQRRLSRSALSQARDRLLARDWHACRSFEELIDRVEHTIGDIYGIGDLMVYDTALRIGAWLSLEPENLYLHAGTRKGAKALGLYVGRKAIPISELPESLQSRPAREVEDVLCIFKERLAAIRLS